MKQRLIFEAGCWWVQNRDLGRWVDVANGFELADQALVSFPRAKLRRPQDVKQAAKELAEVIA